MDPDARLSRRRLLQVGLAAGAGAVLAACGSEPPLSRSESFRLARQDRPVTLPMHGEPIDNGMHVEGGATLRVLGWPLYIKPQLLRRFEESAGVRIEWTNFSSMDDAIARLRTGEESFDIFFPTIDVLGKIVAAEMLMPLNHSYLPNRKHLWDLLSDPFYDRGSHYTVPYFVWTTGIAWRNDHVPESEVRSRDNPYEIFWQEGHRGHVHLLNGSREPIAMTLIKNGSRDVNTADPRLIERARDDLLDLNEAVEVEYDHIDYRDMWKEVRLHQSWSGNIGFSRFYAPEPTDVSSLSYWWPPSGGGDIPGVIGSDTVAIMAGTQAPVAAHALIDFLLDPEVALENVTYEGYQQPLVTMQQDVLLDQGVIVPSQRDVIVRESDFAHGSQILELAPAVEEMWQAAYSQVALQPGRLP